MLQYLLIDEPRANFAYRTHMQQQFWKYGCGNVSEIMQAACTARRQARKLPT